MKLPAMSTQIAPTRATPITLPTWLTSLFAIDIRALAVLRIGLGTVLLYDLFARVPDLAAHYTDAGVLPRSARIALNYDFCEPWWASLHMLSGSAWWQGILFTLAAVAASMVLVGYRTKPALAASLLLLLSLHGRFPMLLQGGDVLLRCLAFWLLFLPLDERWSLSARGRTNSPQTNTIASFGTAGLLGQLCVMYVFTALLKTGHTWRSDFSATYFALANDQFTTWLGQQLLHLPRLLQLLTLASLLLEFLGPLLLLSPVGNKRLRIGVPLAFIGFHLGLAVCMDLGTFPWICILYWLAFLPSSVWDWVDRLLSRSYRLISRQANSATLPRTTNEVALYGSWCGNFIAAFFLAYVLLANVYRLENRLALVGRPPLSHLGKAIGIDQYWNMFSPNPHTFAGWFRIEGELADGTLVNLYEPDEPLPETKPPRVSATFAGQHWRRCLVTLYEFDEPAHQIGTLRYYVQRWNAAHPPERQVQWGRLVLMQQPIPPLFASPDARPVPERRVLCDLDARGCFDLSQASASPPDSGIMRPGWHCE